MAMAHAHTMTPTNHIKMKQPSPCCRIAQFMLSYIFTITVFLHLRVTNEVASGKNEPFLTHLDMIGSGGGGVNSHFRGGSCTQNAEHTLTNLIAKINEDPQKNALVPLEIAKTDPGRTLSSNSNATMNNTMTMEGLHLKSFRKKRIAFLGDSTLFYPAKYLVSMLRHDDNVGGPGSVEYHKMSLGQANNHVIATKTLVLKGTSVPPPYNMNDGTHFQWFGMSGNAHGKTEELIDRMYVDAENMKPEVVVANMA